MDLVTEKTINVHVVYMARYVIVLRRTVQHHYEGHWKGWALKIETFLGPEMATSEASAIWAQKSRDFEQKTSHFYVFAVW